MSRISSGARRGTGVRQSGSDGRERSVDALLKASLIVSRTVDRVLEGHAIETAGPALSSSKVQILRLLGQRGTQNASRIARFLGVSKPAVTQLIDSMVDERLVRRAQSLRDRRGVELSLTAHGRSVFQKISRQQRHLIRNAMRHLGKSRVEQWTRALKDVAAALARADRTFRGYCLQCGAHADGSCVLVGGETNCLYLSRTGRKDSAEVKAPDRRRGGGRRRR